MLVSLFKEAGQPRSVNVQIDLPLSNQRKDCWGMYVAIDEVNIFYGGVKAFKYRQTDNIIEIVLDAARSAGVDSITLEIPSTASEK